MALAYVGGAWVSLISEPAAGEAQVEAALREVVTREAQLVALMASAAVALREVALEVRLLALAALAAAALEGDSVAWAWAWAWV